MIEVFIERDEQQHIVSFISEGHADYSPGNDIVCAGVSAVTIGTVNALDALGVRVAANTSNGYLVAVLAKQSEKAQILLEGMLIMLKGIQESYGDHLIVYDMKGGVAVANKLELSSTRTDMATEVGG